MNYLGDFSRLTFNPSYIRVLLQQGRVHLDADWNEQSAIFWHYLRRLAQCLGGPHWGPENSIGFKIEPADGSFTIGKGDYFVGGVFCHNLTAELPWSEQPFPFDPDPGPLDSTAKYLVYLEVWERHISYIEDDSIREVALGGPDTCTRSQVVWQVKAREFALGEAEAEEYDNFMNWVLGDGPSAQTPLPRPELRARAASTGDGEESPCVLPPESLYRGTENQLYRVQIHREGKEGTATFKWCRDNSVALPVESMSGSVLTLEHLGRDPKLGVEVGDWVELVDDDYVLQRRADDLVQVQSVDPVKRRVTLSEQPALVLPSDSDTHPRLLRWDQREGDPAEGDKKLDKGAIPVRERIGEEDSWIALEDGVQVEFQPSEDANAKVHYRTGDYWLIPARTATGNVDWPREGDEPIARLPHGVDRFFAPLAIVEGNVRTADLRRKLPNQWEPV